jgi:hypothetical protein
LDVYDFADYMEWNKTLSGKEMADKSTYWGMISSTFVELKRQIPELRQDDVLKALYVTSGLHEPAKDLLRNDFDLKKCQGYNSKRIFTPRDDYLLNQGRYPPNKTHEAVLERIEFLGIQVESTSKLAQMIRNKIEN